MSEVKVTQRGLGQNYPVDIQIEWRLTVHLHQICFGYNIPFLPSENALSDRWAELRLKTSGNSTERPKKELRKARLPLHVKYALH